MTSRCLGAVAVVVRDRGASRRGLPLSVEDVELELETTGSGRREPGAPCDQPAELDAERPVHRWNLVHVASGAAVAPVAWGVWCVRVF
jgi:hypothetical protein